MRETKTHKEKKELLKRKQLLEPVVLAHAWNPNIWEAEVEEL